MALTPYNKSALGVSAQVQRLIDKGMLIVNQQKAKKYLERIGYYRLSAYWHPFKDIPQELSSRNFKNGTYFDDVILFYQFDTKLRNNLLLGLGRIEIGLRAALINLFASISNEAYLELSNYSLQPHLKKKKLELRFLNPFDGIKRCWNRSTAKDCVKNYKSKYQDPPPIWTIAETWDWGTLSNIFQCLDQSLANRFLDSLQRQAGLSRQNYFLAYDILLSWLKSLNALRNYCAHQERIWNRDYTFRAPQRPQGSSSLLALFPNSENVRLYHLIVVMCGFHRLLKIDDVWFDEFINLLSSAPTHPLISYSRAGFAPDWIRTKQQLDKLKNWMNQ
ncbi:Abi family protein [Acetobacteraceae bacterium]|nr:Abi family protein [Acetobacteraceae bacterium]